MPAERPFAAWPHRQTLRIDHTLVSGDHAQFPVLVALQHADLRHTAHGGKVAQAQGEDILFLSVDGQRALPHDLEAYDAAAGMLRAWVRVERLSSGEDTTLLLCTGNPQSRAQPNPAAVWDDGYRLVVHPSAPRDVTADAASVTVEGAAGQPAWTRIAHAAKLNLTDAITVEAWVEATDVPLEALQAVVSKWTPQTSFDAFAAYDAGRTGGMDTTGFFGAVFDGRYVYFSPQHDRETRHGKALRYDTHRDFKDPASWEAYDAGQTDGLNTKGYYGAVFDGRYITYPPRRDASGFHSRALRYDTRRPFTDPHAWSAYDVGLDNSSQSAGFDGRYIYFCPGQRAVPKPKSDAETQDDSPKVTGMSADQLLVSSGNVTRYDTQGDFKDARSWTTFDVAGLVPGLDTRDYDGAIAAGRYVYFAPLSYGVPLRYDRQGDFHDRRSWLAYDAAKWGLKRCVGAIFDGRYVYYVPYGITEVCLRHDTQGDFADDASWQVFRHADLPELPIFGYDGALFDGRYIYYIPYLDENKGKHHCLILRYDTTGGFTDPASWRVADGAPVDGVMAMGFNAGTSDGRYLYFAPWRDDTGYPTRIVGHARTLRYDTTGDAASFSLRYSDVGHNGGLCAALPGARFLINTVNGPRSVAANHPPQTGAHHLAGVYDGQTLRLYVDGELVNEQTASGALVANEEDVAVGRILDGAGRFGGQVGEVRISATARGGDWLRTQYHNLRDPARFCRLTA